MALRMHLAACVPVGSGSAMSKPSELVPNPIISARQGLVESFENDNPRTPADHESVARDVIRTRRLFRAVVVLRGQCESKSLETRGDKRVHFFSAPRDGTVYQTAPNKLICRADAVGRGGAGRADRITTSVDLKQVRYRRAR